MLKYESLHNHTTSSDGTQNYLEALKTAEENNYSIVAFTDHDTVPGEETLKQLRAYSGPVKWFVGCEISSGFPKELGGGPASMFHIVGLFTDPTNEALREHCSKAAAARKGRLEQLVKNLQKIGFEITAEECLREGAGDSVGRPHIARVLKKYQKNNERIEELRLQMQKAAEHNLEMKKQYEDMMKRGPDTYPYTLFLTPESFIGDVYVDYSYSVDMDASVKLIRDAGGVAIVAHWGTVGKKIDARMLERFVREKRIDGVEVASLFVSRHETELNRQVETLRPIVERTGCIETIGIDAHLEEEFLIFSQKKIIEETVGMTKKIIERVKPSLAWSNF